MVASARSDGGVRPVLKWCGGKSTLLPEILKRMPKKFSAYHEPFLGGGALFFRLQPVVAHLSDANRDLISMYTAIRQAPGLVIERLRVLEADHKRWPEQTYARERKVVTGPTPGVDGLDRWIQQAASFIYINRTGYNGLWRVNKAGQCNVPMGRYTNPKICDPDAIMAASKALERAKLVPCTFDRVMLARHPDDVIQRGDFVYCDPPYDPVSKTASFRSYTADGFGRDKQRELAETARTLIRRGVKVMLSNSNTSFIRSLYKDKAFRIDKVKAPRSINSDGSGRGKVAELIITGGYPRHW